MSNQRFENKRQPLKTPKKVRIMRTKQRSPIDYGWLIFSVWLTALTWATGCRTTTDPLVGWKPDGDSGYVAGNYQAYIEKIPYGKAVSDDVQKFIRELPMHRGTFADRSESYWIDQISLFEDGTGQHAVRIHITFHGTYWNYVLIYNKSNVRIKTVKFSSGKYRS